MLAMSGRRSSYRETRFGVVVGEWIVLFLQIEQVHNNQQKKQDFMDAPVEGLKKIMLHFRSVAPNFLRSSDFFDKMCLPV